MQLAASRDYLRRTACNGSVKKFKLAKDKFASDLDFTPYGRTSSKYCFVVCKIFEAIIIVFLF